MPYPEVHHKITVWGDAYNGTEQWSFGFRMQTADPSDAWAQTRADAISPAVTAFWNDATSPAFYATHRLQGLKVASIGLDGNYPDGHIAGEVFYANVPGPLATAGATLPPPQASMCVTLLTAAPRGLASKGRFFLPPMNIAPGADGLYTDLGRDQLVTKVKTLIDACNAAEVGNNNVAIFSRGRGVPAYNADRNRIEYTYPNPGVVRPVTRVEVGRVIDTQRRRRRSLVEAREGQPIVP